MKILVTGAAGFIGSKISSKLIEERHDVIGIDNFNSYYCTSLKKIRLKNLQNGKFKFIEADLRQVELYEDNYDLVIHLAAQAGVRLEREKEIDYLYSNIVGFESICKLCEKKNTNLIYASSSSVYGNAKNFKEDSNNLQPINLYGLTKKFNEEYAEIVCKRSNIKAIGLRFFTVYGPEGRPDMAYFSFSKDILRNKKINLFNKGLVSRDMTYIDDVIDGIILTIEFLKKNMVKAQHEIFNLGNGNPIKTKDLLELIENNIGSKAIINYIEKNDELISSRANLLKSKELLKYNPKTNIEEGLREFIKWLKEYER